MIRVISESCPGRFRVMSEFSPLCRAPLEREGREDRRREEEVEGGGEESAVETREGRGRRRERRRAKEGEGEEEETE